MTTTETNETTTGENAATLCHLDPQVLIAHPGNPRKKLRDIDLLAASMGIVGVLEPLTVVEEPTLTVTEVPTSCWSRTWPSTC